MKKNGVIEAAKKHALSKERKRTVKKLREIKCNRKLKNKIGKLKDEVLPDFVSCLSSDYHDKFDNGEDNNTSTIYHSLEVAEEPDELYTYVRTPVRKGYILHRTIAVQTDISFLAY